jgi:hypothetical protein
MRFRIGVIAIFLAVAACGGDDKSGRPADGLSIAATPASMTVAAGGAQTTSLSIVRSGGVVGEAVTFAVSGAPNGVTTAFDTATTDGDSVTLTVTAAPSATQTTATLVVTATADTVAATTPIALSVGPPQTITVSGTVAVAFDGAPIAGATVSIYSAGASSPVGASAAADGTFSIANVVPPYDVLLQGGDGAPNLFIGLTRADPLLPFDSVPSLQRIVTTSLPAGGGGTRTVAVVGCPHSGCQGNGDASIGCFVYGGPASGDVCSVKALRMPTGDNPTSYSLGSTQFTAAGDPLTATITSFSAVTPHDVLITPSAAAGMTISGANMYWQAAPNFATTISSTIAATAASPYTVHAPDVTAVPSYVQLSAKIDDLHATSVFAPMPSGNSLAINVPSPVSIATPVGGTEVDSASTTLSVVNGAADYMYRDVMYVGGNVVAEIVTKQTQLTAAQLAARGLTFAHGANGAWFVRSYDGYDSIDDYATLNGVDFVAQAQGRVITSHSINFTTAP